MKVLRSGQFGSSNGNLSTLKRSVPHRFHISEAENHALHLLDLTAVGTFSLKALRDFVIVYKRFHCSVFRIVWFTKYNVCVFKITERNREIGSKGFSSVASTYLNLSTPTEDIYSPKRWNCL